MASPPKRKKHKPKRKKNMPQTIRTDRLMHRICQDYEGDLSYLNIPINRFNGAMVGLLAGKFTTAQVVTFFFFLSRRGSRLECNDQSHLSTVKYRKYKSKR